MRFSLTRWRALWQRIGNVADDDLFYRLEKACSESHRFYHTVRHIEHCLTEFDRVRHLLDHPDAVEVAIWFHDAVYEPLSGDNEEKSAQWAVAELEKAGTDEAMINRVVRLIRMTRHDAEPETADERFLLDIDLSILGSPPEVFAEYEASIRKEYHAPPWEVYREKRAEVLLSFLGKDVIYRTAFFRERYEEQARKNLRRAIGTLGFSFVASEHDHIILENLMRESDMKNQIAHYENKLKYETDSWDVHDALSRGENLIVIDTRSPEAYEKEHIPSAVNIPHRTMSEETTKHLDQSALYVTYCDGIGCNASTKGALNMTRLGFRVKELLGGLDWWRRDGYATEGKNARPGMGLV